MKNLSDNTTFLTIGHLAKQAGIGVEAIRYYQSRGLFPTPASNGGYRQYPITLIQRIHFIKRSQQLGFSLDEIGELLMLDEYNDKKTIQQITLEKIDQIQKKLDDLTQMKTTLQTLLSTCKHSHTNQHCPIIASLATALNKPNE